MIAPKGSINAAAALFPLEVNQGERRRRRIG
jgi:hypothetical protein